MSATRTLSAEQIRDLEAVLGELIPASADGRMPGADAVGIVDAVVGAANGDAALAEALARGLAGLAAASGASGFAGLPKERRLAALTAVNESQPDFVGKLLLPTYTAYYASPRVARALGLEAWPPHPRGFPLETGDLSLLDPVRAHGPRFREV